MTIITDDVGRAVTVPDPLRRLVSLVPSITETLFALGRGDLVVGATRYCTEPANELATIVRVGGTKNPDLARIAALAPDVVLMNPEENRQADFDALIAAGVPVFVLFPRRVRDVLGMLETLGRLTASAATAAKLRDALSAALAECEGREGPPPRVFCPIWKNPWMTFNHDTYTDDVLRLCGAVNIYADAPERYCTVTLDDVAGRSPDIVLLPDEPYVFSARDLPALAPLALTPAGRNGRVHFIDGKALAWYGPRTAPALRALRAVIAMPGAAAPIAH